MKKVNVGDPLKIKASSWNKLVELYSNQKNVGGLHDELAFRQTSVVEVKIKNTTDYTINQWEVIGLGNPITKKTNYAFTGVAPVQDGHICIAQEPIKQNKIGLCVIFGPTFAKITGTGNYVKISAGGVLTAGDEGYPILWQESGSTERLAFILIGAAKAPAEYIPRFGKITGIGTVQPYLNLMTGYGGWSWQPSGDPVPCGMSPLAHTEDAYWNNGSWVQFHSWWVAGEEKGIIVAIQPDCLALGNEEE